jgi:type I restriction enzyme S subunit
MNVNTAGRLSFENMKYVPAKAGPARLLSGDVLFNNTNSRELVGKTALVTVDDDLAFSNHMTRLRPRGEVLSAFVAFQLYYLWTTGYFRSICVNHVNQASVATRTLGQVPIVFPPIDEQGAIVREVETQLTRLDAGEVALSSAELRLRHLGRSIMAGAVAPPEGSSWETRPLREISDIVSGVQKQPSRKPVKNHYPYLRVANVHRGYLNFGEVKRMELFGDELDRLRLVEGDLLIVEGNGSRSQIGRMATWRGEIRDCVHQNHIIRARPRADFVLPAWIELFWNSPEGAAQVVERAGSTSGLYTLSAGKVGTIMVPVPTIEDQRRLVAEIENRRSILDVVHSEVSVALGRRAALRGAVLRAAFRGELASAVEPGGKIA